jgi:hydrogenase maturation protease
MSGLPARPMVRVLVCGNVERGDDGVAPAAVAALLPTLPAPVRSMLDVRFRPELRVEDLVDLPAGASCLILDAVVGPEPGSVVRLSLGELLVRLPFMPRSSHQLPLDLVVGLAAVLRDRPVEGAFVGLAGRGFGYGTPLSLAARAGMPAYCAAIGRELDGLAAPEPALAPRSGGEA